MTKKVCLVIGAGGGIGANIARKFAIEGYHSCLARRTDQDGLDKWIKNIEAEGGEASGFLINAIEEGAIEKLIKDIEEGIGPIDTLVYKMLFKHGGAILYDVKINSEHRF